LDFAIASRSSRLTLSLCRSVWRPRLHSRGAKGLAHHKWEIKTNAQGATLKAISKVNLEIMRTVACSKLHLISELDLDVCLRLKTLQDHFRIMNQQQVLELFSQYAEVQQKQKNQDINTWLDEYSRVLSLCKAENMAEMIGTCPQ
jgi:hypothetical protein